MADTLDKVNASFEDCEEVEDDVEGAEPELDMTEPMIALDAVMGAEDAGENVAGDIAKAYKVDKTAKDEVKDVTEATVNVETADALGKVDDANAKVVSIGQYRAG